jgi:hypothetical protein
MLRKLNQTFGLDKTLLWGLSSKILTAVSGPVTAALIAYYFSPELQGYHYTFLSLTALQIFVELGLTNILISFASHEWAKLNFDPKRGISGDARALSRLSSLALFSWRWFAIAALALVIVLVAAGLAFLSSSPTRGMPVSWRGPWIALCLVTGINIMSVPAWAILQGCGQYQSFYVSRSIEVPLRTTAMFIAVVMGAGLWAAVISSLVSLIWVAYFLGTRFRVFFRSLLQPRAGEKIAWTHEIFPLQWRIALSWMSGYFAFSLFTPVLFHFQGPVVAGQMGMTWTLITGISGLAATWIQVKISDMGSLVARKKLLSLDRMAFKAGVISVAVTLVGLVAFYGVLLVMTHFAPEFRGKLLPTWPVVIFMIAEVLRQISVSQSSYVRVFKKEPYLILSLVSGLAVGVSVVLCAKYSSLFAVALCYLLTTIMTLIWATKILVQFRKTIASPRAGRLSGEGV